MRFMDPILRGQKENMGDPVLNSSDIVQVFNLSLALPAFSVEPIHWHILIPSSLIPTAAHSHGLAAGVRVLKEGAQPLLANLQTLL